MIIVFMLTFLKVYEYPALRFCHAKLQNRCLACQIHGENKPIPSVPTKAVALGEFRIWRRNDNTELQSPAKRGDEEGQMLMIWFLIRMKCDVAEIEHLSETRDHITVLEVGAQEGRVSIGKVYRRGEMKGGGGITAVVISKKNIWSMIRSVGNDQGQLKIRVRVSCVISGIATSGLGFASHWYRQKNFLGNK